jgi:2-dehydro-3-deoxygluconokinase
MIQLVPDGAPGATADTLRASVAGAESNVAMGLAPLGHSVAWVSRVGADPFGPRVRQGVAGAGVDVEGVLTDPARPTGLFLKVPSGEVRSVTYWRAGSAASAMDETDAARAIAFGPRIVHISGIVPALSETCVELIEALLTRRPTGMRVSFDVNYRPSLWPDAEVAAAQLRSLADRADVVFVGQDEAAALWGSAAPEDVRREIHAPELVVKDAPGQAISFDQHGATVLGLPIIDVIESVGAGDAFAAGYLHGMLKDWGPLDRLRAGHILAARALASFTDRGTDMNADALAASVAAWTGKPEA